MEDRIQANLDLSEEDELASWQIQSMEEVQILSRLDEGHYGEVFHARWRGCEVAVKRIKTPTSLMASPADHEQRVDQLKEWQLALGLQESGVNSMDDEDGLTRADVGEEAAQRAEQEKVARAFALELALLKRLRSNRIVMFMGACLAPTDLCILTEYLPRGSLHDLLHRKRRLPRGRRLLVMVKDIVEGCVFLHAQRIIHRDLKSSNLLLDDNYRVKVADFGLSRILPGSVQALPTKSWAGTVAYMAPEILEGSKGCTEASDIYSFGVVLWEMLAGKIPWRGLEHWQIMQRVVAGEPMPEPTNQPGVSAPPEALVAVMRDCLNRDPASRPSFATILDRVEALLLLDGSNTSLASTNSAGSNNIDNAPAAAITP